MDIKYHMKKKRKGTAATELAITLPLLMTLLLGCIDFGRVGFHAIALTNAVGVGSQYAATNRVTAQTRSVWEAKIKSLIAEELAGDDDFDINQLTVTCSVTTQANDDVRFEVQAQYPFNTLVDWPGITSSLVMTRRFEVIQYQ